MRWIERPFFDVNSGTIQIKLDSLLKPYLLQLKDNFTQYELLWTLNFKSKYTIRLYELVKSIHFDDLAAYDTTLGLDELKRMLDAGKYKTYKDFKVRVLIPAVKEINDFSDKNVSFKPIKIGRAVAKIKLTISTKSPFYTPTAENPSERRIQGNRGMCSTVVREVPSHAEPSSPRPHSSIGLLVCGHTGFLDAIDLRVSVFSRRCVPLWCPRNRKPVRAKNTGRQRDIFYGSPESPVIFRIIASSSTVHQRYLRQQKYCAPQNYLLAVYWVLAPFVGYEGAMAVHSQRNVSCVLLYRAQ